MLKPIAYIATLYFITSVKPTDAAASYRFPPGFKFGAATAAYQIEGAWNEDGKGLSIWDNFTHTPGKVDDGSNGDVACDSYHKYLEDVEILKYLGVHHYRFSLSWTRILTDGTPGSFDAKGEEYYRKLISALKKNSIEPMVTLYHWDLPEALQEQGGWLNPDTIEYYSKYARVVFDLYGEDVKYWLTFNEVKQVCQAGYGSGVLAPGVVSEGIGEYQCAHNVLKAHAQAYHIYDEEFRERQNGKVSMVVDTHWFEPASDDPLDIEAAERKIQFTFGWFAHPIYHADGNYPQVMIDRVAERSLLEGFNESRLPVFTAEEIESIRGAYDYFALNTYSTNLCQWQEDEEIGAPAWWKDTSVTTFYDPSWEFSASGWCVVPWGIRKLLNWIDTNYEHPEIIITENGFSDSDGVLEDDRRINYLTEYLSNVLLAIYEDGINVTGYTVWSLMDNLEWIRGYTQKFGLFQVDFQDPDRPRNIKSSAEYYKQVIATSCLVENCEE